MSPLVPEEAWAPLARLPGSHVACGFGFCRGPAKVSHGLLPGGCFKGQSARAVTICFPFRAAEEPAWKETGQPRTLAAAWLAQTHS